MYKFTRYLLFANLTLFAFSLPLCAAQEVRKPLRLPKGPVVCRDYDDADLVKIGEMPLQFHRHPEAVEASQEALRRGLSGVQACCVKHVMAEAYDAIPTRGREAKDAYLRIIREHPAYEKLPEVAYRLGELNTCIIKKGTKPDLKKGIKYFQLVINRLPLQVKGKPNITYLSLKAHMMLGNLRVSQGSSDEAKKRFKGIYDCDVNQASPRTHQKFKDDKEKQKHMKWLKNRITEMKKRIPGKLVLSCMGSDVGQSMQKLSHLQNEYPGDALINEKASEMLRKLNSIEEIIDEEISDPTSK